MKTNKKRISNALYSLLMVLGLSFSLLISCKDSDEHATPESNMVPENGVSVQDSVIQNKPLVDSLNSNL